MNELTKPVLDIGDTKRLEHTFLDSGGAPSEPDGDSFVLVVKDGVELLREALDVSEDGLAVYDYAITPTTGPGRYTFRFYSTGSVVDAFEDWFYVRASAFANPVDE